MQVFMNHPAFSRQRSKLLSLANISTNKRQSNQLSQSRAFNTSKSNSKQNYHNISINKQEQLQIEKDVVQTSQKAQSYDFSCLDDIDLSNNQPNCQSIISTKPESQLQSEKRICMELTEQSFDNILQDVSNILPSVNSQTNHNTIESQESFNPPINPKYQNNVDISFSTTQHSARNQQQNNCQNKSKWQSSNSQNVDKENNPNRLNSQQNFESIKNDNSVYVFSKISESQTENSIDISRQMKDYSKQSLLIQQQSYRIPIKTQQSLPIKKQQNYTQRIEEQKQQQLTVVRIDSTSKTQRNNQKSRV
eukprot:403334052